MADTKKIRTALISVYHKDGLDEIINRLAADGVKFLSTGGTKEFIEKLGHSCTAVEDLTGYPSVFGGRVKTLHPKVFGGILQRRENDGDKLQARQFEIPEIDLVIVDLYPFEATVAAEGSTPQDIIEKIDIGGISLIRAAAKNFNDVVIVASKDQYGALAQILAEKGAETTLDERRWFASEAFAVSSRYDSAIYNWFAGEVRPDTLPSHLRVATDGEMLLRYGENPHQPGAFYGDFAKMFTQLHGKEISYNNLLDIDAAVRLIDEFGTEKPTVAVLKHNNACGLAVRETVVEAWRKALEGDPLSAFGGIIVSNKEIDAEAAAEIGKIFFEVIIAPAYTDDALAILFQKKNRIVLVRNEAVKPSSVMVRTALNGMLMQPADAKVECAEDLKLVSGHGLTREVIDDMLFANKIVKHSRSNSIVIAANGQLLGSGVGQTSRVDALQHAIDKAKRAGFSLKGATMASDAFFPFADCVEMAWKEGIDKVIQPGGSIRDTDSVDFCKEHDITMCMTGFRHFRH